MFRSSYKIATVWGIPIKVHVSLLIMMVILALSTGFSSGPIEIIMLLMFEIGIFTSIALHELGHSFVALRKGCRVREITLMFLGGAAQMEKIPSKPADEFQMAIAGPAVSVVIGYLCWKLGAYLPWPQSNFPLPLLHYGILCNGIQYLGVINIWLAIFNLQPTFPMDGGRIFRAMLSRKMGRLRATYVAARLGKIIAIIWGIYGLSPNGSLIHVALAFFIYSIAGKEFEMVKMEEAMRQHGFESWASPFEPSHDDDNTEKVIISPPPYVKGPGSSSDVKHPGNDDFLKNIFEN